MSAYIHTKPVTMWYGVYVFDHGEQITEHITRDHARQSTRHGQRPAYIIKCTCRVHEIKLYQQVLLIMLIFGGHMLLSYSFIAGQINIQSGGKLRRVVDPSSVHGAVSGMTTNNKCRKWVQVVSFQNPETEPRLTLTGAGEQEAREVLLALIDEKMAWPGFTAKRFEGIMQGAT